MNCGRHGPHAYFPVAGPGNNFQGIGDDGGPRFFHSGVHLLSMACKKADTWPQAVVCAALLLLMYFAPILFGMGNVYGTIGTGTFVLCFKTAGTAGISCFAGKAAWQRGRDHHRSQNANLILHTPDVCVCLYSAGKETGGDGGNGLLCPAVAACQRAAFWPCGWARKAYMPCDAFGGGTIG